MEIVERENENRTRTCSQDCSVSHTDSIFGDIKGIVKGTLNKLSGSGTPEEQLSELVIKEVTLQVSS